MPRGDGSFFCTAPGDTLLQVIRNYGADDNGLREFVIAGKEPMLGSSDMARCLAIIAYESGGRVSVLHPTSVLDAERRSQKVYLNSFFGHPDDADVILIPSWVGEDDPQLSAGHWVNSRVHESDLHKVSGVLRL